MPRGQGAPCGRPGRGMLISTLWLPVLLRPGQDPQKVEKISCHCGHFHTWGWKAIQQCVKAKNCRQARLFATEVPG